MKISFGLNFLIYVVLDTTHECLNEIFFFCFITKLVILNFNFNCYLQ